MNSTQLFKALGDDTRIRIFILLLRNELKVNEIAAIMMIGQPQTSNILKIFKNCGLVSSRRIGKCVYYTASEKGSGGRFNEVMRTYFARDEEALSYYAKLMGSRADRDR